MSDALRRTESGGSIPDRLRDVQLWLLVDANRWLVIALLAAFVFVAIVLLVFVAPPSVSAYLVGGTALAKSYVELQTIDVTVITIVLSINQLVLTPELGSIGNQRSRLNDVIENRTKVEELVDAPSTPTEPDQYLRTLVTATRKRAERLREVTADDADPRVRRRVDRYVEGVLRETEHVSEGLENHRFGTIEMLGAAMHFITVDEIRMIREIHADHEEALSEDEERAFSEMLQVLELYTVAREYFRSLYVQWEFINFSRAILYLGLPALVVAHVTVGFIGANAFRGMLFGVRTQFWYETAAFTVILVPVVAVISYAARLSMLAKASIFIGPFHPGGEKED